MKEKKPINLEIGKNVKQVRENAGLTLISGLQKKF